MEKGGISRRIINFTSCLVGWLTGGLAHVNIVASMFFGGITGSAMADTSAIGSVLIPAMNEAGYDKSFTTGITSVSSVVGILIPPSIPFVIYAIVSGVSIGKLFLGGLIPGIIVGLSLMIPAYFISIRNNYPCGPRFPFTYILKVFRESILAIVMPIIILGGIIFGIVTATEASAVAVLYSFIVTVFIYKEVKLSEVPRIVLEAAILGASVSVVMGGTAVFSWIITVEKIPEMICMFLLGLTSNHIILLAIINFIFLVAGCFIGVSPNIIILTPIFLPVVIKLGMDPIQFGCMMVLNLGLGLSTPPVGGCLYVASVIAKVPLERVAKGALPFLLAGFFVLILVTYIPAFSIYLPNLLMK